MFESLTLLKRTGRGGGRGWSRRGDHRTMGFARHGLAAPRRRAWAGAVTAGLLAFAIRALTIRGAAILGAGTGERWNFLEVGIGETTSTVIQSLLSGGDGGDTSAAAAVVALWPKRECTHGQKGLECTYLLTFDKLSGIYPSLTDRWTHLLRGHHQCRHQGRRHFQRLFVLWFVAISFFMFLWWNNNKKT